jgi:hypothetical protein
MEMSLEDKLQAELQDRFSGLDKNEKYNLFYFSPTEIEIKSLWENILSERQKKWIAGNHHLILEYSNKRSKWELSVPK